jgi:8-oxo-dGTP pyrophosphatase MutT (NUDIX family)
MKEKQISAGVIILDPVTYGIAAGHVTGTKFGVESFDIFKGHIDEGESPLEAAIRECEEECGLKPGVHDLIDIGQLEYTKTKDLYLFVWEKRVDIKHLKCESFFESKGGKILPEINGFAIITWPEQKNMFRKSLQNTLEEALTRYDIMMQAHYEK